jgi:hypothetical protein
MSQTTLHSANTSDYKLFLIRKINAALIRFSDRERDYQFTGTKLAVPLCCARMLWLSPF